jgi:hypothetical protein
MGPLSGERHFTKELGWEKCIQATEYWVGLLGVHNNMPRERSDSATETQVGKPRTRQKKSRRIFIFPTLFLIDSVLETSQNPQERCLDEESNTKTVRQ